MNKRLSDIEARLTDMAELMSKSVNPSFLHSYLFFLSAKSLTKASLLALHLLCRITTCLHLDLQPYEKALDQ